MIKSTSLLRKLANYYPQRIAKRHRDYVGTMVGPIPNTINSIVICLDLDETILPEILELNPDLIITHHPFFFGSKSYILKHDVHKSYVYNELKKAKIGVISFHTNFDEGKYGMNDALAELLSLENVYAPIDEPMMRIGYLKNSMSLNDFVIFAKKSLNIEYGLLTSNGSSTIKKVGIVGGGGSYLYKVAQNEKCDIYISGDVPHHTRRDIIIDKYNYLDVPHEVERIFMPQMKKILESIDSTLNIKIIDHEKAPKVI